MHLLFILLFTALPSLQTDLQQLDSAIGRKAEYDALHEHRIDSLRQVGNTRKLYSAFNSYQYDSAFYYVGQLVAQSEASGDPEAIASAKIKQAYVFLAGGRFRDCEILFTELEQQGIPEVQLAGYYSLRGHLLYDVAHYQHSPYPTSMRHYYEQALAHIAPSDSGNYWNIHAQLARCDGRTDEAIRCFQENLRLCQGYAHSEAIFMSSIAQEYFNAGDSAQALHYWAQAAARDIQSSTKEVVAMQQVAQLLHAIGNYDMADRCIRSALEDASLFHARHRQLEVGEILPIIDAYQLEQMRGRSRRERVLYICILILLLSGGAALFIILGKLRQRNRSLTATQEQIRLINVALEQSNHVKETYLAAMLTTEADHTEAEERYVKYVTRAVREKRWDDLLETPPYISRLGQRTAFYHRFDTMFLHLYPDFIGEINSRLTEPMDAKQGSLPSELRVFALMRLGADDNEQMAHILSCSLATVHTYKARIFSRLTCSKEEFLRVVICAKNVK